MAPTRLELSEEALSTIGDMQIRVAEIGNQYGHSSDECVEAQGSLIHALVGMIRLGGTVTKDGELSLYSVSFIHFGVIWHPKRPGGVSTDPLLGSWSLHS